ncbi:MAG: photosynthetic reaction center cytochrome c subunit [Bacteroidetes Order II. Incertae sedis bacterium]|nr:photosynthetic reaction center cytochrome c subunit [Bacteroidetes Order II. bacterium]
MNRTMKATLFLMLGIFALPLIWATQRPTPSHLSNPVATVADSLQADRDRHTLALIEKYKGREQDKAGDVFPNLKVQALKDLPLERFYRAMNLGYSRGLGVSCNFCHNVNNWADETNEHHAIARDMARLVEFTNAKVKELPALADKRGMTVNCSTCHQGHKEPPRLAPPAGARPPQNRPRNNP